MSLDERSGLEFSAGVTRMDIGIPKEIRGREHRVALAPSGVKALTQAGARVWVQKDAGVGAGFSDADFETAGATTVYSRGEVFGRSQLVVGINAPDASEYGALPPHLTVVAFWGLPAARPDDFAALVERRVTAIGVEVIEDRLGHAPLLTAMSEIAGMLALTIGSGLLLNEFGGKGILLSGAPAVPPASFVILGAGVLGRSAARAALGLGAHVVLLDRSVDHLRYACEHLGRQVPTMLATRPNIEKALSFADLVLAAVAVRGERAPLLVTREMLKLMKPRSVVMDLSIDMGGCFETSRPTSFPDPVYEVDGILHFCVPNLPSVAARSATLAYTNALLPFLMQILEKGVDGAVAGDPELRRGVYLYRGECAREALAHAFGVAHRPLPPPEG
jgi:alanine dehydrogenase